MPRIKIPGDFAWAGLCRDCTHATLIEDEDGRRQAYCSAFYADPILLRRAVARCSSYRSKTDIYLSDLREIAWSLETDDGGKKVGFVPPKRGSNNE